VRLGTILVVGLTSALELGCAARVVPLKTPTSVGALTVESASSRDPVRKLRGAPVAAGDKEPSARRSATDRTATTRTDAPVDSEAAPVGTSGDKVPPSATDAAPTPPLPTPPSLPSAPTSSETSRQNSRQPRDIFMSIIFIGVGLVATVLVLVFGLFTEHHRHE